MTNSFDLRLLGPLQVEQAGKPLKGFKSRKVLALLAYLIRQKKPVSRSSLADMFWGDKPENVGRANLSSTLYNLSKNLPGCFQADHHTVQFQLTDAFWIDSVLFESLVERGGTDAITEAITLYQGEFLAGFYLNDCPDFEIWLVREREYWHNQVTRSLTTLIVHHTNNGQYEIGLRLAHHLLKLDPWREEAHRYLMRLHALNGQRSAALVQYKNCYEVLAEELDVEPSAETTALYERIRAGEFSQPAKETTPRPEPVEVPHRDEKVVVSASTAPAPPLHNLPVQLTPFIGRETELTRIADKLNDPNCRLLTLVGLGGVGKTRLALKAAKRETHSLDGRSKFSDGVYFVSLAAIDMAELLVPAVADALKIPLSGDKPSTAQLLDYLQDKKMLLVLDNFEHLLADSRLLLDILIQAPQVKIMVTSRERLNLQPEWMLEVKGLNYPPDDSQAAENYSAAQLFVQVARRAQAGFLLSEPEQLWVGRICQLTGGLPLAIELAASWTRLLSCQEIARELEQDLGLLKSSFQNMPDRHRSMQAVFAHSWGFLSEEEKLILQKLSVFRGGFQREAAQQVTGATLFHLSNLVDKSLLYWHPTEHGEHAGRYKMHKLLRQYAADKFQRYSLEQSETCERHANYYATFLQQRQEQLKKRPHLELLQEVGAEIDNVRAGWRWIITHGHAEKIEQYQKGLFHFYDARGWYQEGLKIFEQALKSIEQAHALAQRSQLRASLLLRQTHFAEAIGNYPTALTAAQQAIEQARQAQDPINEIKGYLEWGHILQRQGHYEAAQITLEYALTLTQTHAHRPCEAKSLHLLAQLYDCWGRYRLAERHIWQALAIYRAEGDLRLEAKVLEDLGSIYYNMCNYAASRDYLKQAFTLYRTIKDQRGQIQVLYRLGQVCAFLGNYQAGQTYCEQALEASREIGVRGEEANALKVLGLLYHHQGHNESAQRYCEQAATIDRELGHQYDEGYSLTYLGYALEGLGDFQPAAEAHDQALRVRCVLDQPDRAIDNLAGLARVAIAQDNSTRAIELLAEILAWIETNGVHGLDDPFRVCLTCYQILAKYTPGDSLAISRAQNILATAYTSLQKQTSRLKNKTQHHQFLEKLKVHRETALI